MLNYRSRFTWLPIAFFLALILAACSNSSDSSSDDGSQADTRSWQVVGSVGFSSGTIDYTSLAIDSSGTPYVAYQDADNSSKATVMYYDSSSSSWKTLGSAEFSAGIATYISLAFDSSDIPYVAYRDYGNSGKATVMYYNSSSSSWNTLGSAGFSADIASYISLAFDSAGTPYVAYTDNSNGNMVTVMYYDSSSSSWEALGSAGFSSGGAVYTSLAIGASDTPYVAYGDYDNSSKATVMYYDSSSSSWKILGSAGFSAAAATYINLAFDSSGTPYVAYHDWGNSYKATVMYYDGSSSSWKTLGSAGFIAGYLDTSLAIDASGTPYVACSDYDNSYKATVMYYDSSSSSWKTLGSAGFSEGEAYCTRLAIDASGTPYVAYSDGGSSSKATVMRYK